MPTPDDGDDMDRNQIAELTVGELLLVRIDEHFQACEQLDPSGPGRGGTQS
jgi:hypothetical protein